MLKFMLVVALVACSVVMVKATTTDATTGTAGIPGMTSQAFQMSKTFDFSAYTFTSNDVIQAFAIPSNTVIELVVLQVVTAGTNAVAQSPTVNVGDGDSVARYISAQQVTNSALAIGIMSASASNKIYTVNDTIDIKSQGAINSGTVKLTVKGFKL